MLSRNLLPYAWPLRLVEGALGESRNHLQTCPARISSLVEFENQGGTSARCQHWRLAWENIQPRVRQLTYESVLDALILDFLHSGSNLASKSCVFHRCQINLHIRQRPCDPCYSQRLRCCPVRLHIRIRNSIQARHKHPPFA